MSDGGEDKCLIYDEEGISPHLSTSGNTSLQEPKEKSSPFRQGNDDSSHKEDHISTFCGQKEDYIDRGRSQGSPSNDIHDKPPASQSSTPDRMGNSDSHEETSANNISKLDWWVLVTCLWLYCLTRNYDYTVDVGNGMVASIAEAWKHAMDSMTTLLVKTSGSSPDDQSLKFRGEIPRILDMAAADAKLKTDESCTIISAKNSTDATSFYSTRLASNIPTEDEHSYDSMQLASYADPWRFWGIYDGYGGWATSNILAEHLPKYVMQALKDEGIISLYVYPEKTSQAITQSFLRLDNEIMQDARKAMNSATSHAQAVSRIAPAYAGSSALLAIFEPRHSSLHVACVGNSRAVLGRRSEVKSDWVPQALHTWTAKPLSADQNALNEDELKRIKRQHPVEPELIDIKTGTFMGLPLTRAFGDLRNKWTKKDIEKCKKGFFGQSSQSDYNFPPYLTAKPVITETEVKAGDFAILANKGFWDHMSSEDAVECVSLWLQAKAKNKIPKYPSRSQGQCNPGSGLNGYATNWKSVPEDFVVEDRNVATHLVRNALGGHRRDLFCSVMSAGGAGLSHIRDDITVQVIIFGDALAA